MQSEQRSAAERQSPITVVVVDDEHLIRSALALALSTGGIELVGEAASGEDAIQVVVDSARTWCCWISGSPGSQASR
jgi:CheY-like chemotaxis protein